MISIKKKYITLEQEKRHYNTHYALMALTGGVACGKSQVSKIFEELKIPVICADKLVKEIYKDKETLQFIATRVPDCIGHGHIDFPVLREKFFSNKELKSEVENHIYTRLPREFQKELLKKTPSNFVVYDVPLLFEKNLQKGFDYNICVTCTPEIQTKRLVERDNISLELAKKIISSQIPIQEKSKIANSVIENNSSLEELRKNTIQWLHIHTDSGAS